MIYFDIIAPIMSIELSDFLTPPDHEQRCDVFVEAVLALAPEFPLVQIFAENETKRQIDGLRQKTTTPLPDVLIRNLSAAIQRISDRADKRSAREYVAAVDLWGKPGRKGRNQTMRAIAAIQELANSYHPDERDCFRMLDFKMPYAHLTYIFTSGGHAADLKPN
jgi:hypothetical protein